MISQIKGDEQEGGCITTFITYQTLKLWAWMLDINASQTNMVHQANVQNKQNPLCTQRAMLPNSILKQKHPTCAKLQTYQATRNLNGRSKEMKEIVLENSNSANKDCYDVVDLLACLEKAKVYLGKSERILKETPTVSKQLKQNSQSELSKVAETLQNISRKLFEHFTRPDFGITAEKKVMKIRKVQRESQN